ncbi:HigA family addiction module antitoxin [Rouxiella badensis]|uniref:HigA family addiction module antitoxin n=1 Tax=Rouxiella badensis TaxID=1646377 RepID=UPI0013EF0430|nr:HigA family addiction module antitoxin [Rouxiella badensis]QII38602.1 HigA family addiction module antidote protein [Rouxiella badensis]
MGSYSSIKHHYHPSVDLAEYMRVNNIGLRQIARCMDVSPSTVSRILSQERKINAEIAIKLSVVVGNTAFSWLEKQILFDISQAEKFVKYERLTKIPITFESKIHSHLQHPNSL